jgi:hypothetical protein
MLLSAEQDVFKKDSSCIDSVFKWKQHKQKGGYVQEHT